VRDILWRACAEFERNGLSRSAIRQCEAEAPVAFLEEGLNVLLEANDSAGYRFLALLLLNSPLVFRQLTNRWKFTRDDSVKVAKRLQRVDQSFDTKLTGALPDRDNTVRPNSLDGEEAERALEILDEISPGRRIVPTIRHLTGHPNPKISSKAALLIGKRLQNLSWAKRVIAEASDARLRANAIETMWGVTCREVIELFRECLQDWDNRVVGNAIIGLHRAGDPETFTLVDAIANDPNPKLRMTAAWAMGYIGDPKFVSILAALARDSQAEVRRAALKSLRGLHIVEKRARKLAPDEPHFDPQVSEEAIIPEAVLAGPGRQFWG
jgi:hypothetical protein